MWVPPRRSYEIALKGEEVGVGFTWPTWYGLKLGLSHAMASAEQIKLNRRLTAAQPWEILQIAHKELEQFNLAPWH